MNYFENIYPNIARIAILTLLGMFVQINANGQEGFNAQSLSLEDVRQRAAEQDPRAVKKSLLEAASQMQLSNIRARRLPQVSLSAQATMQNEVPEISMGGMEGLGPPLDQYRAQVEVNWLLYSGGRLNRSVEVEEIRSHENQAGVERQLQAIRNGATEVYFSVLLLRSRADVLNAAAEDLENRLSMVEAMAQDSAALPADAALIEAEKLLVDQRIKEVKASEKAALSVLSGLLNVEIPAEATLTLPDFTSQLTALQIPLNALDSPALSGINTSELTHLMYQKDRLAAESKVVKTALLPQVSVFGQAGLGRPGTFNFLSDSVNDFSMAGVRLQWSLLDWGQTRRQGQLLQQQASMVAEDMAAVRRQIVRDIQDEQAAIDRLVEVLEMDEEILNLREEVLRVARHQFDEGVLLPADYVNRLTKVSEARANARRHKIELVQAQARLLSALGQKY